MEARPAFSSLEQDMKANSKKPKRKKKEFAEIVIFSTSSKTSMEKSFQIRE